LLEHQHNPILNSPQEQFQPLVLLERTYWKETSLSRDYPVPETAVEQSFKAIAVSSFAGLFGG
jgi:hypothetical protein